MMASMYVLGDDIHDLLRRIFLLLQIFPRESCHQGIRVVGYLECINELGYGKVGNGLVQEAQRVSFGADKS